jgi:broad specificity phosphatase PhoE
MGSIVPDRGRAMTRLVLVRHGETAWHAENRYAGASDIPLNEHGREQAEQLATWAKTAGLDALWASPLTRALQTAAPVAASTRLEPRVDPRLREVAFGDGEGLTRAEMRQRFPEAYAAFVTDPVTSYLPGGEDPVDAVARASACLTDIAAAHPTGRVLLVTHSTLIRLLLCHLLGIPLAAYRNVFPSLRNCAITEVALSPDGHQPAFLEFNSALS